MKIQTLRKVGEAYCAKHKRGYDVYSGDGGIGCPECFQLVLQKSAEKLIKDMDKAHKEAGNSTIIFGTVVEDSEKKSREFLGSVVLKSAPEEQKRVFMIDVGEITPEQTEDLISKFTRTLCVEEFSDEAPVMAEITQKMQERIFENIKHIVEGEPEAQPQPEPTKPKTKKSRAKK